MTKNADPDKYKYSRYGIGFDARGIFLWSVDSGFGFNVIIFDADISSSVHIDNKKKDILIFIKGPADGLDDTTLTAEKEYFTKQQKKFCLNSQRGGVDCYIFTNVVEIYKFKAKDSKINAAPLCLSSASKIFNW